MHLNKENTYNRFEKLFIKLSNKKNKNGEDLEFEKAGLQYTKIIAAVETHQNKLTEHIKIIDEYNDLLEELLNK